MQRSYDPARRGYRVVALLAATAVVLAMLIYAATAAAAVEPTEHQYDTALKLIDPAKRAVEGSGSLPFTGLDLVAMAVAAAGLTGAGLFIRQRAR